MLDTIARVIAATDINVNVLPHVNADNARLQIILNTFFGIIGAIALLVLVIAGLRYVNSAGDAATLSKVKRTIIYAGVGLIVTMVAFSIVSFILGVL